MTDPTETRVLELADLDIIEVTLEPYEVVDGAILVLRTVRMTDEGRQVRLVSVTSSLL